MISSRTRSIAIIGNPIEHSITPRIQNHALRAIEADIVNIAFRVPAENLEAAVKGAQAQGMLGLMVTIPHKEAVIAICDELDESARLMGAANLLQFTDGRIVGHSTDGWAAIESLKEEGIDVRGSSIAILGGGGAARSLALTFARHGAKKQTLINRTVERAEQIAREVRELGSDAGAAEPGSAEAAKALRNSDILVNATSIGMYPKIDETPLESGAIPSHLALYDIVYNPLETRFLREAKERGSRGVDGLGMLIYTNVAAIKICAGLDISPAVMRAEAMQALGY